MQTLTPPNSAPVAINLPFSNAACMLPPVCPVDVGAELLRLNQCSAEQAPALRFIPLHKDNEQAWTDLQASLPEQAVGYDHVHCAYQHLYFSSHSSAYQVLDCLLYWQEQVIGIWPLACYQSQDGETKRWQLSSHLNGTFGICAPLLIPQLSAKQEKMIARAWLSAVAQLASDFAIESLSFAAPLGTNNLPHWYHELLTLGAQLSARHSLVAELNLSAAAYQQQLRKSYKGLINQARKLWRSEIDSRGDRAQFAEFQRLHEQVAGRQTRNASTWEKQYEAIVHGAAYALYLRDAEQQLVGASLFNCSRDEAYYAVGVYQRELFAQPLAHLNLYEAITFARQQGLHRLILGHRPYPNDQPAPSEKELQIAFFKEGFANQLILQAQLSVSAQQLSALLPTQQNQHPLTPHLANA
ncbi:MAG: hypothetical protein V4623_02775 [Pseudomonadota bacterium]